MALGAGVVEDSGQLSVKGMRLVDAQGRPVVLRGVSYGWHNWWPRFYNESTVKEFAREWKCSVVRASMGISPQGAYLTKPDWSEEKICAIVDAAIKENIYVIIDWHSHEIHLKEATDFFAKMAKKYGKHPHVIYEIYNEPVDQSWEEVKHYSEAVIKAIRREDPDNIILVGSPHWDTDLHLVAEKPITGEKNIMYTVHFYAGSHKQPLRDRCDDAMKKGVPLFASECASMSHTGDGPLDREEWQRWLDWMEKNKISWVVWSVADKEESCSMLRKTATDTGPWQEKDMKEWGILIRKTLRKLSKK